MKKIKHYAVAAWRFSCNSRDTQFWVATTAFCVGFNTYFTTALVILVLQFILVLYALARVAAGSRMMVVSNNVFVDKKIDDVVKEVEPLWTRESTFESTFRQRS